MDEASTPNGGLVRLVSSRTIAGYSLRWCPVGGIDCTTRSSRSRCKSHHNVRRRLWWLFCNRHSRRQEQRSLHAAHLLGKPETPSAVSASKYFQLAPRGKYRLDYSELYSGASLKPPGAFNRWSQQYLMSGYGRRIHCQTLLIASALRLAR